MTDISTLLFLIIIISLFGYFLYYFLTKKFKKNILTLMITLKNQLKEKDDGLKLFSNVFQQLNDGIAIIDEDKNIIFVNKSFRNNIRSGQSDNVKKFELLTRNYELNGLVNEEIEAAGTTPVEKNISYFDRADEKIVRCKVFKINGMKNYAIIIRDITFIQKGENIKSTFIQNMSHEIKTPITAIMGFIETLKSGALDSHETAIKFFNIIEHHAKRLNSLVDDLIVLTNIETNKTPLKIENIDIRHIIDNSMSLFIKEIKTKKIDVIEKIENVPIFSDCSKVNQIVINLLQNAVKYSENNGIITIEAKTVQKEEAYDILSKTTETSVIWYGINKDINKFLYLSVEDTGIGVSYTNLLRLGERFFRVDSSHSQDPGGTGLGLAIVKHTIKLLDGTAILQSGLGKGVTFSVLIPSANN